MEGVLAGYAKLLNTSFHGVVADTIAFGVAKTLQIWKSHTMISVCPGEKLNADSS